MVPFHDLPLTGLLCGVCGGPQRETPGGPCCQDGHGGAAGVPGQSCSAERDALDELHEALLVADACGLLDDLINQMPSRNRTVLMEFTKAVCDLQKYHHLPPS